MGSFFTNITLVYPDADAVAAFLREENRIAYVLRPDGPYTVICDFYCEGQDTDELAALNESLSARFSCVSLAVLVHDDDYLWLDLRSGGQRLRASGWNLAKTFGSVSDCLSVGLLLHLPGFVFATDRLRRLAAKLRLPLCIAGYGFNYIREGDLPPGFSARDIITAGAAEPSSPQPTPADAVRCPSCGRPNFPELVKIPYCLGCRELLPGLRDELHEKFEKLDNAARKEMLHHELEESRRLVKDQSSEIWIKFYNFERMDSRLVPKKDFVMSLLRGVTFTLMIFLRVPLLNLLIASLAAPRVIGYLQKRLRNRMLAEVEKRVRRFYG